MTASDIAKLLHARRIGKGKWMAKCCAHDDKAASLSITEMSFRNTRLHCFSGCTQKAVLDALGLVWADILGERDVTREMRGRWKDEQRLHDLEHNASIFLLLQVTDKKKRRYWEAAERNTGVRIEALRGKLFPEEAKLRTQREKVYSTIAKFGFEKMWAKLLSTARGKAIDSQYGVTNERLNRPETIAKPSGDSRSGSGANPVLASAIFR
jgi:hypothetical protein